MVKPLNFVTRLSQPVIDNMQASVTIGIVLLLGISPVLPRDILIAIVTAILLLTVVGWFKRWVLVPPLGVFCVACITLALFCLPSQLCFAFGLTAYAATVKLQGGSWGQSKISG